MILLLIVLFGFILRIYLLDVIPGEMWGDVIEHYKMASDILNKNFFFNFRFGGDGPLISYFIAFFSKIFGLSFWSIKFTTVFIGCLMIVINYLIAKEFFKNKTISYLNAFLTAVGFWALTFSRQGKPYILAGLFISLTIYLFLKKKPILLGLIIGLGMYSQAAFWGMFLLSFSNITTLLVSSLLALPLIIFYSKNSSEIFSSYSFIGEKFVGSINLGWIKYIFGVTYNYFRNVFALFLKGDEVFRHNIPGHSHLDFLMQLFFLLGLFFIIKETILKKYIKYLLLVLFSFLILLPTSLDVKNSLTNPSMGRTVGLTSVVYLIVAYGIYQIANLKLINRFIRKKLFIFTVCLFIFLTNFYLYFYIYPRTLPSQNIPFSKLIANEIDRYDLTIPVYLFGCCWADNGHPEPHGIWFQLTKKREHFYFEEGNFKKNLNIPSPKILLVVNPNDYINIKETSPLYHTEKEYLLEDSYYKIAKFFLLEK